MLICWVLLPPIYASDACKYSDFNLNTLPDNPMKAIKNFTTIGSDLTFMGYSYNNQPAVQLITLKRITEKFFEILTIRDLHSEKYLALDIIQQTSPKEYLQIRTVGQSKQHSLQPVDVPEITRIVNNKTVTDQIYTNQVFPHWVKISLICRNGKKYNIFHQKERILAEVYYTKNGNNWEKTYHHHLYPSDHPMVKKQ